MKTPVLAVAFMLLTALQLMAQESSVKILLNQEERFRFDSIRLEFVNSGFHVMIGDSTGMNDTANFQTIENTFIGHGAGSINQGGSYNTFLGARAGENHTVGNDNVYLGAWAGMNDSAGSHNTYVGANAGWQNKTGQWNTFVGYNSGRFNNSGNLNAFFGRRSGEQNISGRENTFIGTSAGTSCLTGSYNTYIGRLAGFSNLTGDSNVYIGYFAGINDTSSNKLIISNSETWDPLVYGEFDNRIIRFNAQRVEIRDPGENTIIGDSAGVMNSGVRNMFVGYHAGYNNTTASDNIFIGDSAGYFSTTGEANVFLGNYAGWSNTTGNSNVMLGNGAGPYNLDGYRNVMVGTTSGYNNTSGYENIFLGTSAGSNNTTGSCNTYLGRRSGKDNQEGDSSVFIGYYAGAHETTSNKLYIANSETNDPLVYGEFDNGLLRVNGTLDINNAFQFPTSDGTDGQVLRTDGGGTLNWAVANGDFSNGGEAIGTERTLGNTDDYALGFKTNDEVRLHINYDGNVGIGTSSPSNNLEVAKDQGISTITATTYRVANFSAGQFIGRAARGTMDAPSAVQADDALASFNGRGYGETGFSALPRGRLGIYAAETWTDASQGAYVIIGTTPAGTTENTTERMRVTSEGDVGIGTSSPEEMLEVSGNAKADTVIANAFTSNSPLLLQTNKTTRIYVDDATGNVGIGTTAPDGILDIAGSYHFPGTDGSNGQVLKTDGSGELNWATANGDFSNGGEAGGADRSLGNTDDYALSFITNNTSRFKINDDGGIRIDGNVGIFTDPSDSSGINKNIQLHASALYSNPYVKISGHNSAYIYLESRRTANTSGKTWSIASGSGSVFDLDKFFIYNGDDGYCLTIRDGGNVGIQETEPGSRFVVKASGNTSATSALNIKDVGDNSLLYIRDDGNVGIGTTSPAGILDIAGAYHFPDIDGSNGQVLQTDGSGTLSWTNNAAASYAVGDFALGGIVFWVDETGQHGLVCDKEDLNGATGARWYAGTFGDTRAYGDGPFSGEMNTAIIIAAHVAIGDDGSTYSARMCSELQITEGGKTYGDWYLPSRQELNLMYVNKATINATAVANGGSVFGCCNFASSTEDDSNNALGLWMSNGQQESYAKQNSCYIRAVRAF